MTVAVVRPNTDPKDLENFYKRGDVALPHPFHFGANLFIVCLLSAAYSDAMNADILRQLETFTLEYDKYVLRGPIRLSHLMHSYIHTYIPHTYIHTYNCTS